MAKANSIQIKLVSSAETGFYYITRKNPRTLTDKVEMRKYDPVVRKHVMFKEAKIKWIMRNANKGSRPILCGGFYFSKKRQSNSGLL